MPRLFFEILGEPAERGDIYEFSSIEVKQTAFRIDGVFTPKPDSPENTVIFTEVQFQRDETLYERLFSEIMLYLAQNLEVEDWRAVVFYPRRNLEQKNLYRHRNLLNSDQFQAIYLEDFLGVPSEELGIQLMQLIISPERDTNQYLSGLVKQYQGKTDPKDQAIIKLVSTIMLYKFPKLTRDEIESMFTISDLKQTRVYKDAVQEGIQQGLIQGLEQGLIKGLAKGRDEGRAEGRDEGRAEGRDEEREQALARERSLIKRMLTRKLGELPTDLAESVQTLSFEQLADLGEALFDFEQPADLAAWLTENIEGEDDDRR